MDQGLYFGTFGEKVEGSRPLDLYPAPEQFLHRVPGFVMEISLWQEIPAAQADGIFVLVKCRGTTQADPWKEQRE